MARTIVKAVPTHYQILQVHPDAPPDLITAVYWRLVSQAQTAGTTSKAAEVAIYHLTRSYQVLADPKQRDDYDRSLGIFHEAPSLPPLPLRRSSSWVATLWPAHPEDDLSGADIDHYELLRLDSQANPGVVAECWAVMRNHYMRLVEQGYVRAELIDLFEEAYGVISDPSKRRSYDRERKRRLRPRQAAATVSVGEEAAKAAVNGKKRSVRTGAARRSKITTVASTETNGAASGAARPGRATGNGKDAHGKTVEVDEESATIKVVRSLAVNSAAALRIGGKGSVTLAKKASKTLRDALIDVEATPGGGGSLTLDEERVLADRLSTAPRVFAPEAKEAGPQGERPEALARLTLTEGPGRGTVFEITAVPFTLGEAESCDVALSGIASRQASILHHNGHFVLYSLTDAPQTVMRGESVLWAVLHGGDTFEIGPYRLSFEPASPVAPAP